MNRDYSLEFKPYLGPNRCKFYNQNTDSTHIAHDMVVVEADDYDDDRFDPTWLGPTPNPYHYGYCQRCGQPFKWNMPDFHTTRNEVPRRADGSPNPFAIFGWMETTKEEIAQEFQEYVQNATLRARILKRELSGE